MNDKPIYLMSENELNNLLIKLSCKSFHEKQSILLEKQIGTPYKTNPLGTEQSDVINFNYNEVDCTTFMLINYSLTLARTLTDAHDYFRKLLYYPDNNYEISYENRIHFTYDRITGSDFFKVIDLNLKPNTAELTLNVKSDGTRLIPVNYEKNVEAVYFRTSDYPFKMKNKLENSEFISNSFSLNSKNTNFQADSSVYKNFDSLHFPVGIALIKENNFKNGHIVSHEGFLINPGEIIHASSEYKKVVRTGFTEYILETGFDGFILFKLTGTFPQVKS